MFDVEGSNYTASKKTLDVVEIKLAVKCQAVDEGGKKNEDIRGGFPQFSLMSALEDCNLGLGKKL